MPGQGERPEWYDLSSSQIKEAVEHLGRENFKSGGITWGFAQEQIDRLVQDGVYSPEQAAAQTKRIKTLLSKHR